MQIHWLPLRVEQTRDDGRDSNSHAPRVLTGGEMLAQIVDIKNLVRHGGSKQRELEGDSPRWGDVLFPSGPSHGPRSLCRIVDGPGLLACASET